MSSYIGVRCPVCNKKFSEADDIVVCPICGAPHHRDCYAEKNQCAFVADHLSGKEWSDPNAQSFSPGDPTEENAQKTCTRCGGTNTRDSVFCQTCGSLLNLTQADRSPKGAQVPPAQPEGGQWSFGGFHMPVDAISMAYGGLSPEQEIEGETVRDLAQYVGNGSAYYLPRFQALSASGRSIMPNFSALLFNFFFFFYRKMYLIGGILLALYIVSVVPACLYTWEVMPQLMHDIGIGPAVQIDQAAADHFFQLSGITRSINFCIGLVFSLCANRFYYAKTLGAVHNIRTEAQEKDPQTAYAETLSKSGGASKAAVIVVLSTLAVAYFMFSMVLTYLLML